MMSGSEAVSLPVNQSVNKNCIPPNPSLPPSIHLSFHPSVQLFIDTSSLHPYTSPVSPCLRLFINWSIHQFIPSSISLTPSPSTYPSIHPSVVHPTNLVSIEPSVHPSIHPPTHPSILPSRIPLSIFMTFCPSIYPSNYCFWGGCPLLGPKSTGMLGRQKNDPQILVLNFSKPIPL